MNGFAALFKIQLRSLIGTLFANTKKQKKGTRIALGSSWRVLVAAEMVIGSGTGLGYAIIQSRWTMDYVAAFVCIMVIALIGLSLERLVFLPLEKRTLRLWRISNDA